MVNKSLVANVVLVFNLEVYSVVAIDYASMAVFRIKESGISSTLYRIRLVRNTFINCVRYLQHRLSSSILFYRAHNIEYAVISVGWTVAEANSLPEIWNNFEMYPRS